jgi:ketosteroid isomerase-like protein
MSTIAALDNELNQMILQGKALDAFEKFYDETVVMQENSALPTEGKGANRKREHEFFAQMKDFHGAELVKSAVQGDVAFSQWSFDVTFANGHRTQLNQVAVRTWNGDKIVHERFFYTLS